MGKHINAEFDGRKLKVALKQKGIKQEEFAKIVGVTQGTMSKIVTGERKPSVTLNKVMCLLLGVPEDTFLIKPEPPKPEPLPKQAQDNHALAEATDKLIVYLERIERKQDRLEMLVRSVQNENLALRQELLKRK